MRISGLRRSKESGVNVLAAVLMIMLLFLVIGFSIGALSTMNLNLSGRSINVIKANKIAEAAVAEFLYYVEEVTYWQNQDVAINDPVPPPLKLNEYYDGGRNILPDLSKYTGEECRCDVNFNRIGAYYSTDNLLYSTEGKGSQGHVPPFTIDLVITVTLGDFVKHYQAFINRKWEYAIFMENAPVLLINRITDEGIIDFNSYSEVRGNIMSLFRPTPRTDGITTQMVRVVDEGNIYFNIMVPGKSYSPSVLLGCEYFNKIIDSVGPPEVSHYESYGISRNNKLMGSGLFGYPDPSKSYPGMDVFAYPDNKRSRGANRYNLTHHSPFDSIKSMNPVMISNLINDVTCEKTIYLVDDYNGIYTRIPMPQFTPLNIEYEEGGSPTAEQLSQMASYKSQFDALDEELKSGSRKAFFLAKGLHLCPPQSPPYSWPQTSVFEVCSEDGESLPLLDHYRKYAAEYLDNSANPATTVDPVTGKRMKIITCEIKTNSDNYGIDPDDNTLELTNCAFLTQSSVELEENTQVMGDNCLIQVGNFEHPESPVDFKILSGKITAGKDVGIIIYCQNFSIATTGTINGNVLATNFFRVGNQVCLAGAPNANRLALNGSIAIRGNFNYGESFKDFGGLMATGFDVKYDPSYNRLLNRFGPIRVASFRSLE